MNKKLLIFLITLSLGYYLVNPDINNTINNLFHDKNNENKDLVNINNNNDKDLNNSQNDNNKDSNTSSQGLSIIKIIIIIIGILLICFFAYYFVIPGINNKKIQETEEDKLKKELAIEIRKILSRETKCIYHCLSYSSDLNGRQTEVPQIHNILPEKKEEDVLKKLFDEPAPYKNTRSFPLNKDKKYDINLDELYKNKNLFSDYFTEDEITIIKGIRLFLIEINGCVDSDDYIPIFKIEKNETKDEMKNIDYLSKFMRDEHGYKLNLLNIFHKDLEEFKNTIKAYSDLDFSENKEALDNIQKDHQIYKAIKISEESCYYTPLFLTLYFVCEKLLEIHYSYNKYEEMPKKVRPVYKVIKKFLKFYLELLFGPMIKE